METQLKAGRVRLVISGADRQLVQAVLSRFLNWWDASGHRDLVASNEILPLPDVSWSANSASISLPVNYECPTDTKPPTSFEILNAFPSEAEGAVDSTIETELSIEPYELAGVVGGEMLSNEAHDAASAQKWTFHIIDDVSDATLKQFPSEADAAREAAKVADVRAVIRTRRRRAGPVMRASSRAMKAALVSVSTTLLRMVTLPVSLTAVAITQCARYAYRTLARSGRAVASVAVTVIVAPWRLIAWLCSWTARATGRFFEHAKQAVPRAGRRIAAIGSACALAGGRAITIPWSLMVLVTKASGEVGQRVIQSVAQGSSAIVAPRMVMRAAFCSVVLAVVITASVARPSRIVNVAPENGVPENVAPESVTPAPSRAIAASVIEPAPLPSRSLAMFTAPARLSRVRVVASRPVAKPPVRVATAATQRAERKRTPAAPRIETVNQEYVASLMVMSEPSGATVRIDGQTVGTTPLQLDRVRVGSHAVHVALDGYPAWSAAATVVYGKSNGVVARLGR